MLLLPVQVVQQLEREEGEVLRRREKRLRGCERSSGERLLMSLGCGTERRKRASARHERRLLCKLL